MTRIFNFSAGPAALPLAALEQAREELLDWHGSGMSVMEMSHRGSHFMDIAAHAESTLRELLAIPEDYAVLFLQGGATLQFSAVPLNLAGAGDVVDYVCTGAWSKKAMGEARRFSKVNVAADGGADGFVGIPAQSEWQPSAGARYLHYTANETIGGVEFHFIPDSDAPLVADMSSTLLSRPLDVSRFGLIYAGAQKNLGPAGLTLVIVRRDLIGHAREATPSVLDYAAQAEAGSMLNTPPTFAWYLAGLVLEWIKAQGGLAAMAERNRAKAELLYAAIDRSGFYSNPVEARSRSWMNVPFMLADAELDKRFLGEAAEAGLANLKGHRSVGGMRASLYNAIELEAVQALVAFMEAFERRHG